MTHTLHRQGDTDDLRHDFVVLITPAVGINNCDAKNKLQKILDKVFVLEPINIGSYETGTIYSGATIEEIKQQLSDNPRVRCCFDDIGKVKQLVRYLKEEDFGLSVTISGMIDEIATIASEFSLEPHSVNLSLGIFGRTDLLPGNNVLKLVSLCGHGMVTEALAFKVIDDYNLGYIEAREAAKLLAKPCICGIYNTTLAEKMLQKTSSNQ